MILFKMRVHFTIAKPVDMLYDVLKEHHVIKYIGLSIAKRFDVFIRSILLLL